MSRSLLRVLLPAALLSATACGGRDGADPPREAADGARAVVIAPIADRPASGVTPGEPALAPTPAVEPPAAGAAGAGQSSVAAQGAPLAPAPRAPPVTDPSAEAILARAERAWGGVRSFRADFTQRLSVPLMGTEQRSRGEILHRRPDRFLMKFSDPAGDVLVADGRYFWMYYPSTDPKQVLRSPVSAAGGQIDLQREFLSNPTERYAVTKVGEEAVGGRPAHVLTLVPKGASPYRLLKVWVDKDDFLVRRFEMTEENESVRRIELSDLKLNVELPDALFRFAPPPGAQVFDQ